MKVFEGSVGYYARINWVDENNVLLGFDWGAS